MNRIMLTFAIATLLAACGDGDVNEAGSEVAPETTPPEISFKPDNGSGATVKPQGPVAIAYRIIGTPIVGQPLGIDLQVTSMIGPQAITLSYRVNDSTALQLTEAQPVSVTIVPSGDDGPSQQQVRVVPLREGRLFLNVSASVDTDSGTMSTVTAIPIQVGSAPREIQDNGTLTSDESGAPVRSLPASEN